MNKQKISAKPREASKAPLSPRGKASKKTTATSADNRAEIAKTVSDILGDILDKKLGEIEKRIDARIEKAVSDILGNILDKKLDEIKECINAKLDEVKVETPLPFSPGEAIPAYYKKLKDGSRQIIFDEAEWESGDEEYYEPDECIIGHDMCDTNGTAEEIDRLDPKKIGDLINFLKRGGLFLRTTMDLLNYPRLAIKGDMPYSTATLENGRIKEHYSLDIKIGALQLFKTTRGEDEETRIDAEARAPFDKLLSAAMQYIKNAEKEFPLVKGELHTARDNLQTLSELLAQCVGIPGSDDCYEVSDAAKKAIEAARIARIKLEDNPLAVFADKVKFIVETEGCRQGEAISDLLQKEFAGAFPGQTKEEAAERQLRRAGLLGNHRATKSKKRKLK